MAQDWTLILQRDQQHYKQVVGQLQCLCGGLAHQAGWDSQPVDVPRSLMLTVSELSEGMKGHRKSLMDDKLPQHDMLTVELGDAIIRILHLADRMGLPLADALVEKLIYNTQREDHKAEVRAAEGGKKY